jgi:hypothetical protein
MFIKFFLYSGNILNFSQYNNYIYNNLLLVINIYAIQNKYKGFILMKAEKTSNSKKTVKMDQPFFSDLANENILNQEVVFAQNYLLDKSTNKVVRHLSLFAPRAGINSLALLDKAIKNIEDTFEAMKPIMDNYILITQVEGYQTTKVDYDPLNTDNEDRFLVRRAIVWSSNNSLKENKELLEVFKLQDPIPGLFNNMENIELLKFAI